MSNAPRISIRQTGQERQPVVVIDNFFPDAAALQAAALAATFVPARNLYPGIRAPLPDDYWSDPQLRLCRTAIAQAFNLSGAIRLIDASFSIVTTQRNALLVGQCLPHPDAFNPRQIALVHYLSHDFCEGTAFYRHRSTGLEAVSEMNRKPYFETLDAELERHGPPPREYICGDTDLFEQTHVVDAAFNRALLYRGQHLHSGAITPQTALSPDPAAGRLTVTAFMTVA